MSTEKEKLAKLKAMTHKGTGVWVCPICNSKYADSDWRRADPERITCQNGHHKVKLVFYASMSEYGYEKHVKQNPKVKEIDW